MHLVYHDTVWLGVDRTGMNGAIWKALKPGGEFAVIDHSAKDGTGADAAKDLHRIEKSFVQNEIEARPASSSIARATMFATPADTRDWSASPTAAADKRGTTDRFVLVFRKQTGK
jgi:predicted methyltransferase